MNCIAHRGFAGVNPENTLTAVGASVAAGADAVELDVRRCGSDELVAIHDPTVDRVTAASGRVDSFSAAELRSLSVFDSGDGVPTLEAVCRELPPDVELVLDLKEHDTARDAVETARRHGCDPVVSSRSAAVLAETADASRAYVFQSAPELTLREADDLGCTAVHPHWHLCTDSFLSAARELDLSVNAWPVDSLTVAADLATVGVDGIIVDSPTYCDRG